MTNDDGLEQRIRDLEHRLDAMRRRLRGSLAVAALSGALAVAVGSVLAYQIATDDPGRPLLIGDVAILRPVSRPREVALASRQLMLRAHRIADHLDAGRSRWAHVHLGSGLHRRCCEVMARGAV